jgi:putative ABC transport system substrate-binding protein
MMAVRRRDFITLLAGASVISPLGARARQSNRMRHIGMLVGTASGAQDPVAAETLKQFDAAMRKVGWIEGKNIRVDYRFGGDFAKTNSSATELVALAPELIYALGLPAVQAVHQKTHTIPIVFTQVADPVSFGVAESLQHPGGNITGFMVWELSIGGKWIQLLHEIAPGLSRVGIIYNPDTARYAPPLIAFAKAAAGSALAIIEYPTHSDGEVEAAAAAIAKAPHGGLLIIPEPFTTARRDQIIAESARFGLPTMQPVAGAVERGALISYSYAFDAIIQEPVEYIDRILKGESPGELPIQTPTKFELAINHKTAEALGLKIPPTLLATADKIIE